MSEAERIYHRNCVSLVYRRARLTSIHARLTERKAAEEERNRALDRAEAFEDQFLATLSHELVH